MLSLALLAAIMAAVTLAAGFAPLYISSKVDVKALSLVGSGVIIGTAFLVVIPEGYEEIGEANERAAGVAVLTGFMLMLAISTFLSGQSEHAEPSETVDLSDLRLSYNSASSPPERAPKGWWWDISVTTLGLVIHAAADGIALGAAEGSTNSSLRALIFVSILIHKAPAAFSLTAILMTHKGYTSAQIKRDVVIFALAGPVLALLVGFALWFFSSSGDSKFWPGVALSLSGGTFVFVVTHIIADQSDLNTAPLKSLGLVTAGMIPPFVATYLPD